MPQLLRETAQIKGEVAVMGNLTYLEVRNLEALRKEIEENPITDEDTRTLDESGHLVGEGLTNTPEWGGHGGSGRLAMSRFF